MDTAPILAPADLEQAWRRIMEPLGFGGHSVWLMVVGPDARPAGQLFEITDAARPPTPRERVGYADFIGDLREGGLTGRVAVLRSRPGGGGVGSLDRMWAGSLYDACQAAGVPCAGIHLATDRTVLPIPLDELPGAAG